MTPTADWMNTPQYQRAILRLAQMTPDEMAIVDSLGADTAFAKGDMQNQLQLMKLAAYEKRLENELEIKKGELGVRRGYLGLAQEAADWQRGQDKWAGWIGLADVGVSGLLGYGKIKVGQDQAIEIARQKAILGRYGAGV